MSASKQTHFGRISGEKALSLLYAMDTSGNSLLIVSVTRSA